MADRPSRLTTHLDIRVPGDDELADLVTVVGDLADAVDDVVVDRLAAVGRFLGTFTTNPPTTAEAIATYQPGDYCRSTAYGCHLVWDVTGPGQPYSWHQLGAPTLTTTEGGGIKGYITSAQAAGVTAWHNGFLVFDASLDRLYASSGGIGFVIVGGKQGASVSTGFVTAAGWSITAGQAFCKSLGNGTALVSVIMTKTTAALTVPVTGDIANTPVCTLPTGFEASGTYYTVQAGSTGRMVSGSVAADGAVTLTSVAPGANVAIGDALSLSAVYTLTDPLGV